MAQPSALTLDPTSGTLQPVTVTIDLKVEREQFEHWLRTRLGQRAATLQVTVPEEGEGSWLIAYVPAGSTPNKQSRNKAWIERHLPGIMQTVLGQLTGCTPGTPHEGKRTRREQ